MFDHASERSIIVDVVPGAGLVVALCISGLLLAGCEREVPRGIAERPQAQPAAAVQAAGVRCPAGATGAKVRIAQVRSEEDRSVMKVTPNPELGGEASLMWRGDLNADGREDLMLWFFELCGNAGECPWAVYAGCGEDNFVSVWGPEYTVQLEAPRAKVSQGWADLTRVMRITTTKRDYASRSTLRFTNGAYRAVRGSEKPVR
jgi:hypothetical protein